MDGRSVEMFVLLHAKMRSSLHSPSHASVCAGHLGYPRATSGYLQVVLCVYESVLERQLWILKVTSEKTLTSSSVFVPLSGTSFKNFTGETEPVRSEHGLFDAGILPGQSWGGHSGGGRGLSEQLPDLSVDVAEEVHVGGSTVQTFVLHQELAEQHLWFVFLPHDLELREKKKGR